jgi:hypothetical protein
MSDDASSRDGRGDGALIEHLVRDLTPVRPLPTPLVRLARWWLPGALLVVAYGIVDARPDLAAQLARPAFLLEVVAVAGIAGLSAALALRGAVPGLSPRVGLRTLGLASIGLVVLSGSLRAPDYAVPLRAFLVQGVGCGLATVGLAILPIALLLAAARRGASVSPAWTGAFAGGAGAVASYLAMRLHCPLDGGLHVGLWHAVPMLGAVIVAAGAGRRLLGAWA